MIQFKETKEIRGRDTTFESTVSVQVNTHTHTPVSVRRIFVTDIISHTASAEWAVNFTKRFKSDVFKLGRVHLCNPSNTKALLNILLHIFSLCLLSSSLSHSMKTRLNKNKSYNSKSDTSVPQWCDCCLYLAQDDFSGITSKNTDWLKVSEKHWIHLKLLH